MYAHIRNLLLKAIPGEGMSDIIYLGLIVFIIARFFSSRKWRAFIATVVFAAIFAVCDYLFGIRPSAEMLLNFILLPFVITLLYVRE